MATMSAFFRSAFCSVALVLLYSPPSIAQRPQAACPTDYSKDEVRRATAESLQRMEKGELEIRNFDQLVGFFDGALARAAGGQRKLLAAAKPGNPLGVNGPFFNITESAFYSCYPELKNALAVGQRIAAEKDRKQKEANLKAELERNKPENLLRSLYDNYLLVRVCFETRKGYAVVYVNDSQMSEARRAVKIKEQELVKRFPNLETDKIWQEASQSTKGFSDLLAIGSDKIIDSMKMQCTLALAYITSSSDAYTPPQIKKDF